MLRNNDPGRSTPLMVRVKDELTMDFDNTEEFAVILERVKAEGVAYGSGPTTTENKKISHRRDGRRFYFLSLDGHNYEMMTA